MQTSWLTASINVMIGIVMIKKLHDAIARLAHALGALIENDMYWQSQKMNLEYKTLRVEEVLEWLTQKSSFKLIFGRMH